MELTLHSLFKAPCIIFRAQGNCLSVKKAVILWGNHILFWGQNIGKELLYNIIHSYLI